VTFNRENTLDEFETPNGTRIVAQPAPEKGDTCAGCAFDGFTTVEGLECSGTPECSPSSRTDKRDIIWVRAEPKALDLTAHTRKVLMLSTGHITQHTSEVLTACSQARKGTVWAAIAFEAWAEYGWLMYAHDYVIDDEIARSHPELLTIFEFARKHDFGYVWLDCDWETLPPESGLPVFEW
jgi:hypothetical protein